MTVFSAAGRLRQGARVGILDEKTAIVTGGGSGIGFAIAERFHDEGANVVICGRNEEKLSKASSAISPEGARLLCLKADISAEDDIIHVVKETVREYGAIDILVNNAGMLKFGRMDEVTPEEWEGVMRTNAFGTWRFMVAVLAHMRMRKTGSIINISSINGIKAFPGTGVYGASKAAMQMLSQVMAMEAASDNIRINMILPGLVEDTDFSIQEIGRENLAAFWQSMRKLHPLGRNGKPSDIADAALFLASDKSQYITGVLLNVDGGRHLATNRPPAA